MTLHARALLALFSKRGSADIREVRKGVSLGGLKIRDLINEGRKY
jgi:hypothetical protein